MDPTIYKKLLQQTKEALEVPELSEEKLKELETSPIEFLAEL